MIRGRVRLDRSLRDIAMALFIIGVMIALVAMALMYLLVLRPIKQLKLEAQHTSLDVLGSDAPDPPDGNEVVALAHSFRSMRAGLIARGEQLAAARDAADAANHAKSRFLANMSHEIRTPMNGVLGMTDPLLDTELNEKQRKFAMVAFRSGEALLAIINDILDLSKIEAGKLELESIQFNVAQVVQDVTELSASRAREKGLQLSCRIDQAVPDQAIGDPGRLRQILTNLVGNAIKFTEHGRVDIAVQCPRHGPHAMDHCMIDFSVDDTGIGLSPQTQANVFAPFSQADNSTTRKSGGTGLGLAISRQLVEAMGGQVSVQSALGQGAMFRFSVRVGLA